MKFLRIHEDILRHLWSGQYLDAQRLVTLDGRHLVVLKPGTLNRGSGPDFRDGVIALDGRIFRGDIEFHRTASDWKLHSHDTDENYNSVVLHVVYRSGAPDAVTTSASGRSVPILAIEQFLSSPLEKILEHTMRDEHISRTAPLQCVQQNTQIDADALEQWIRRLSLDRMKAKAVSMLARLLEITEERQRDISAPEQIYRAQHGPEKFCEIPLPGTETDKDDLKRIEGWQQLLYEGIMDGLGYSKNRMPFVTLAQHITIRRMKELSGLSELSVSEIEAILFHASGLRFDIQLINDQDSKIHLHRLHTAWHHLREKAGMAVFLSEGSLRASDWVFSPTRPSNFPTIRIAVASELLARITYRELLPGLLGIVDDACTPEADKLKQLLAALSIDEDPFWSFHYSFAESSPRAHSLLGETRKDEIIINTILPLCSLYALVFEKEHVHERALRIAIEIPPIESNFITRKMGKQLLADKIPVFSAFQQQGLIQLYERYCSINRCKECEIGRNLVITQRKENREGAKNAKNG